MTHPDPETSAIPLTPQKQELLLNFYRIAWDELCWRRNAGYRTVILGIGYFGILLTVVGCVSGMQTPIRICLASVVGLGTLFGCGYLTSNYYKYMSALDKMVQIEAYVGAYGKEFLGVLGSLMPESRKGWSKVPLLRNPVCIWSVAALLVAGAVTTAAILLMHGWCR